MPIDREEIYYRAVRAAVEAWESGRGKTGRICPAISWRALFCGSGMYFLSLEVQGTGLNTRLTRKIALSN